MITEQELVALVRKVVKTKDPADYKAFSDAYDELYPEELEKVGGGYGDSGHLAAPTALGGDRPNIYHTCPHIFNE